MFSEQFKFSGLRVIHAYPELHEYIPFIEFNSLDYYPELTNHWGEHFLGEVEGKYYTMFVKHQYRVVMK